MKLWQAILLTLLIVFLLMLLPNELIKPVTKLVLFGSAIWIYFDGKKLKTEKYKSNLGIPSYSLAAMTFLFWPIFFPGYLWLRYRIKNNLVAIREKYKEQK